MYKRPDGLYEKILVIKGKRVPFRGKTQKEVFQKIAAYNEKETIGRTFKEVADDWESEHFGEIENYTANCYKKPLLDVREEFDGKPIRQIKPMDIQRFINDFAKKGFAKQTVKLRLTVLRQIFDYAILHGDLSDNSVSTVKLPKGLSESTRKLPKESDIDIIKNSVDSEFGLFAYLLLYTGLRRGEALALRYGDIDFEKQTITVERAITWNSTKPELKRPKSESGIRVIPLLKPLADKLPKGKKTHYIFGGEQPFNQPKYQYWWDKYKRTTGISLTPHQLRHEYATMLYDAKVDPKAAQELLGHSKESVTMDIYTHIRKQRQTETAKQITEHLEPKLHRKFTLSRRPLVK